MVGTAQVPFARYYGANATRLLAAPTMSPADRRQTMRRPTKDPYARPAIQTLERLHAELGGKILENRQQASNLAE
jgi:hypothetical protein